ncbi:MAG: hypothetical protein COU65_03785 [Candidatus Pacebacteria bacterium CG10_big_fil_rev_8_21_14_0_10_42_12]|nr:hypothetical protein [Candidatus Paceibacterota bacterium]PIR62363.1 MAG: hypothetical protein COU65_03785 [Candidatus Pacebacteria bacterium CG10_big_fil_rev_8_21_14_0_10_42_12]
MGILTLLAATTDPLGIGTIDKPAPVGNFNADGGDIGILVFISTIIKLLMIVGSLWVVINIFLAAYIYISGNGDASANEKVSTMITNSVIGLVLLVTAYTITAIFSLLFFGSATFILNPTIQAIR